MGIPAFLPDRDSQEFAFTLGTAEQWKPIGKHTFVPLSQAAPELGVLQSVVIKILTLQNSN
jgi:hypothetical protein